MKSNDETIVNKMDSLSLSENIMILPDNIKEEIRKSVREIKELHTDPLVKINGIINEKHI